ncbi:hypothetical protein GSY71_01460 [Pusillimonas sp. TS35]|uniref:hypothetical protein n=1 Tax=Paracandidimonas lactea TaxID=2895524 RepID=UPI00136BC942|nr:hypothetical protein [Paracandidimonas lactea]MYN11819.1 hypothetical protein [Pusillimonas sp. TS35]
MPSRRVTYIYATKGGRLAFIDVADVDDGGSVVLLQGYIVENDGNQTIKRAQRWDASGKVIDSDNSGDDLLAQV